jgi:Protein of unknown function (DUF4038)/Domain of unknown function (DUF5060)
VFRGLVCFCFATLSLVAQELGKSEVYAVAQLIFVGSPQGPGQSPAKDTDFWVRIRHQSGSPEYRVYGFWDGGASFKLSFCPTRAGKWNLLEVHSNDRRLSGQKQGGHILAQASKRKGFWEVDAQSPGRRWYKRSDGSHQYIFGNTQYSFLSETGVGGRPNGSSIARDVKGNAAYFKKVRFSAIGDRYPDQATGPFLDESGKSTYDGAWSHRPNPDWFRARVDLAVQTAFEADLIADMILAGPDLPSSRSSLSPAKNAGDPSPFLRYVAARYGAYPNVWMCLANEFDIKTPKYSADRIKQIGAMLRQFLPYPTPVSVHRANGPWLPELNATPSWNDHVIVQNKLKTLAQAADAIDASHAAGGADKPVIDDELSYQGSGDGHTESDTLESHLGAFLGGGYGTTGFKSSGPTREKGETALGVPVLKTGQYFTGNFKAVEHTAARGLEWLRGVIDERVTFWEMTPGTPIFHDLDANFRGMAWPNHEYVLGTDKAVKISATLPPGEWDIASYDVIARRRSVVAKRATGTIVFDAPDSRAVLFHIAKSSSGRASTAAGDHNL